MQIDYTIKYLHNIYIEAFTKTNSNPVYININCIINSLDNNKCTTIREICRIMPDQKHCSGLVIYNNNQINTASYLQKNDTSSITIYSKTTSIDNATYNEVLSDNLDSVSIEKIIDDVIPYVSSFSYSQPSIDRETSNITLNITSSESSAYPGQINATIYVPSTNTSYSFDSSGMSQSISYNQNELLTLTITTSNAYRNLGIGDVTGANVIVSDIQKMQCYIILTGDGEIDLDIRSYVHQIVRDLTNVTYSGPVTSFENELVEFGLTPKTGIINSISITGVDSETIIEYSNNGNNSYSFTMPNEDVMITVTAS